MDAHEAPDSEVDGGESAAAELTAELPQIPRPAIVNGWPVAVGRAAVPSAQRLIELELPVVPPQPEGAPEPVSSVRTPLAAGLLVMSGLMLAGVCSFAMLMPSAAQVGPGPIADRTLGGLAVLPAPLPPLDTPTAGATRPVPVTTSGQPARGNQGGNAGGGGGGNPVNTGGGVPVLLVPSPPRHTPTKHPAPSAAPPTSAPPTTQPPTTQPPPPPPTTEPPTQAPPTTDPPTTDPPPSPPAAEPDPTAAAPSG